MNSTRSYMGEIRQDITDMVEKMPAFPTSVHRVLALTSDMDSDPKELIAVIEHDPVIIMKILRLVNSPYFRLSQKIASIKHAVVNIGLNTIKNLALSVAAIGALPRRNEAGFDMEAFLLHSLATATIAKLLAVKLSVQSRDSFDYFLSGLLHDFGKIVFAHFMPLDFHRALTLAAAKGIPLYEAEEEIFHTNHAQVGALLGEKWNLPKDISEALKSHHGREDSRSLPAQATSAANELSKELKIGAGGSVVVGDIPPLVMGPLGGDVATVMDALGDIKAELDKAMIFVSL